MLGKNKGNGLEFLEQLDVVALEELLRQEFLVHDAEPDIEYIMTIMEVIKKKEQGKNNLTEDEIQTAWNDFITYFNTDEGKKYSIYVDSDQNLNNQKVKTYKKHPVRIKCLLIAAVLVIIMAGAMLPVFGYKSIFGMFAEWTEGTFHFSATPETSFVPIEGSSAINDTSDYSNLKEALDEYGIDIKVLPTWIPDGFNMIDLQVNEFPDSGRVEFYSLYSTGERYFNISIKQYSNLNSSYYEMDQKVQPEIYTLNGIDHYIFINMDQYTAAWYVNNIECSISGDISLVDIKKMIYSIY